MDRAGDHRATRWNATLVGVSDSVPIATGPRVGRVVSWRGTGRQKPKLTAGRLYQRSSFNYTALVRPVLPGVAA